eukprot:NODE_41_length_34096_cov_2.002235.p9 type:complete len:396 gc:universal NODE_41_length_34096_cov_2.002235:30155-28968(-)
MDLNLPMNLDINFNEKLGRHLLAKEDLDVGECILFEAPYLGWELVAEFSEKFSFLKDSSLESFAGYFKSLNTTNIKFMLQNFYTLKLSNYPKLFEVKLPEYIEIAEHLSELFHFSIEDMLELITIPLLNGHMLDNQFAIFNIGSKFSHDCDPNCAVVQDGNGLKFVTCKSIKAGDVLSISYLPSEELIMPTLLRRYNLLLKKSFFCFCKKCCSLDITRCFKCDLCDGLMSKEPGLEHFLDLKSVLDLYSISIKENQKWQCSKCENAIEIVEDMEFYKRLLEDDIDTDMMERMRKSEKSSWAYFKFLQVAFELYAEGLEFLDDTAASYLEEIVSWLMSHCSGPSCLGIGLYYASLLQDRDSDILLKFAHKYHWLCDIIYGIEDEDSIFLRDIVNYT